MDTYKRPKVPLQSDIQIKTQIYQYDNTSLEFEGTEMALEEGKVLI